VAAPPQFDAATATRSFSLLVSDYTTTVLLQPLLQRLARTAPGVRFTLLSQVAGDNIARLESGEIDLLIVPEQYRSERHPSLRLFDESYVCVTCADNATVRERLSFDDYLAAGHVVTRFGDGRIPAFDSWLMVRFGVIRRIEVTVASLTAPAEMVLGTQRIATVHRRLADRAAARQALNVWPPPLEIPALVEYVQWNRVRADDAAIGWLVAELKRTAAELG
jgi:DNA-binding transcriptional LysR family regulator